LTTYRNNTENGGGPEIEPVLYPFMLLRAIFIPLMGLWNLLVYVRPRYMTLRDQEKSKEHGESSLKSLRRVIWDPDAGVGSRKGGARPRYGSTTTRPGSTVSRFGSTVSRFGSTVTRFGSTTTQLASNKSLASSQTKPSRFGASSQVQGSTQTELTTLTREDSRQTTVTQTESSQADELLSQDDCISHDDFGDEN